MKPAPVSIEDDLATRHGGTSATSSASLPGESRMSFGELGTDLLRRGSSDEGEESDGAKHDDELIKIKLLVYIEGDEGSRRIDVETVERKPTLTMS